MDQTYYSSLQTQLTMKIDDKPFAGSPFLAWFELSRSSPSKVGAIPAQLAPLLRELFFYEHKIGWKRRQYMH